MRRVYLRLISILLLSQFHSTEILAKAPELVAEDAGKGGTHQSAEQLAALVIGDANMDAASINLVNAVLTEMFNKNKDMALLESAYPGMQTAIRSSLEIPIKKEVVRINVQYRGDLTALYAANLSEADILGSVAFFKSSAGSALLQELQRSLTLSSVASEFAANKQASAEALSTDQSVAGVRAIYALSAEHRDAVVAFFGSPVGKNLAALNEKKMAIDIKWSNYLSPEAETEVETVVVASMIAHIAKTDPATAKAMREAHAKEQKRAE